MRAHAITTSLDPNDGAPYNPTNTFCPFLPTLLPADEYRLLPAPGFAVEIEAHC
jgi:hypothetical protein